jgi:hypothetical protein
MVRLGVCADTNPDALVAEGGFTGAPHSELLFPAGSEVLRRVILWLAETAEMLGGPSVGITSVAPGRDNNPSSMEWRIS